MIFVRPFLLPRSNRLELHRRRGSPSHPAVLRHGLRPDPDRQLLTRISFHVSNRILHVRRIEQRVDEYSPFDILRKQ